MQGKLRRADRKRFQRDLALVLRQLQAKVLRCSCGTWFYQRHGRQRYCRPLCSQRERTARWQAKLCVGDG